MLQKKKKSDETPIPHRRAVSTTKTKETGDLDTRWCRSIIDASSPQKLQRPHLDALPGLSLSQPLLSFMASGTPRWWPSSLALLAAHQVSRFPHGSRNLASSTGVKNQDLGKADTPQLNPSTNNFISPLDNAAGGDDDDDDDVTAMPVLRYSSHRDGSIYRDIGDWKIDFALANRNKTPLEAMSRSHSTDCRIRDGMCGKHQASHMLQIFSLRLAKIPVERGPVELYGYIAARDAVDSLLNYVVNIRRDDPIIVKQGSLINMFGPKRGIILIDATAIEYDMKIKTGKCESEDLQLIDGVSTVDFIDKWKGRLFTERIHGDCGAIDVTAACIREAVEVTVEVEILQMQGSFNIRLSCFTSGIDKEIRLFNGAIVEPRGLPRFVVAVYVNAQIDLVFKLGAQSCLHSRTFKSKMHGHEDKEIKTDFALIAVKVTWSTILW